MGNKPSAKRERKQVVRSLSVWHLPPPEEEKRYDFPDATLTFVDEDDVLDFLCADYKSRRAKMSCGHAVTPMSLTHWCRRQLDKGGCEFVCGQTGCDVEWPFEEVCKMALLTPEEIEEFNKKIFENAKDFLDIKFCPGCKSRVVRTDLNDQSVQCTVCTAKRGRTYTFCWQCLKEWRGLTWLGDCGNDDCHNPLEILKSCPDITFKDVRGVTGCPSVRACPTCGSLVEHNRTKCKNVVCGRCKVEFCFVCLKLTKECLRLKPSSHYELCSSGVAPRQTSIPVWQRT
ncbi:probable E3 ubiquitin-protein ligase RNF144A-A [Anarrhichthys ocellatus]|uniref:probable E3 ubiquitin-protein ligase RNF144A-A n=1 Tax=Anarrhichthys ocellatus TaxID=433405 RepID=UPI0012EED8E5|nr:probable E3 ubiquitin-protein ligase RNF144A-A [Anarrhichthys ocellatus]